MFMSFDSGMKKAATKRPKILSINGRITYGFAQ